ncbi:MAG: Tm-1-like ATP-binding domain-containing protein [Planctomycetaceae bacterium]
MAKIAVLGTLDSKGAEHAFVAEQIRALGHIPVLIDAGTLSAPTVSPEITRESALAAAGLDLSVVLSQRDRGAAVSAMAAAAARFLPILCAQHGLAGVISLGGSSGTAIASAGMRALPVGFPRVLVSTMAGGHIGHYVGTKDVTMMPSVVDISGLNRISRVVLSRAAGAICGMVAVTPAVAADRPVIVASMFGNTTGCINAAVPLLEEAGYEVLIFHANGVGGRTMESLVESGLVSGVLDVTTTELADELAGGVLSAGPDRGFAAPRSGVPAIVTPGCLDMVNFGPPETIPEKYAGRKFYVHNPQVTLMRTTAEECERLGRMLAERINASTGPVTVLLPLRGISMISSFGGPFHDAEADAILFTTLCNGLRKGIRVRDLDCEINSVEFAGACAEELLGNMQAAGVRE